MPKACKFFALGICSYGSKCNYSHTECSAGVIEVECKFERKGRCVLGDKCIFLHPQQQSNAESCPVPVIYGKAADESEETTGAVKADINDINEEEATVKGKSSVVSAEKGTWAMITSGKEKHALALSPKYSTVKAAVNTELCATNSDDDVDADYESWRPSDDATFYGAPGISGIAS